MPASGPRLEAKPCGASFALSDPPVDFLPSCAMGVATAVPVFFGAFAFTVAIGSIRTDVGVVRCNDVMALAMMSMVVDGDESVIL